MITKLQELLDKLAQWFEKDIPDTRLKNDQEGRYWLTKTMPYTDAFKLKSLREYTNRDQLNQEYVTRYLETDVKSRKGISALKVEISALYSFNKSWVQRYKGRMHFYRDDLSQKGARNMTTVGQAFALFKEFKKNLDQAG